MSSAAHCSLPLGYNNHNNNNNIDIAASVSENSRENTQRQQQGKKQEDMQAINALDRNKPDSPELSSGT